MSNRRRNYSCLGFIGDILMILITAAIFSGFPVWLVWIFIREMRLRNR